MRTGTLSMLCNKTQYTYYDYNYCISADTDFLCVGDGISAEYINRNTASDNRTYESEFYCNFIQDINSDEVIASGGGWLIVSSNGVVLCYSEVGETNVDMQFALDQYIALVGF